MHQGHIYNTDYIILEYNFKPKKMQIKIITQLKIKYKITNSID